MNEMNKKLINEVKDYFITVRTYIQRKPRNEQNMKLLELIDTLLRIDNLLDTEYEDLVDQLKDFDRGINLGIRHQFIKFKRSVLKLQVQILLKKKGRIDCPPNIIKLIDMMTQKIENMNKLMDESDPVECGNFIKNHETGEYEFESKKKNIIPTTLHGELVNEKDVNTENVGFIMNTTLERLVIVCTNYFSLAVHNIVFNSRFHRLYCIIWNKKLIAHT